MIWSIIPEEMIFAGQSQAPDLTIINYLGRRVATRGGRVDALLSTNPADFLDPRFAPGSIMEGGSGQSGTLPGQTTNTGS